LIRVPNLSIEFGTIKFSSTKWTGDANERPRLILVEPAVCGALE